MRSNRVTKLAISVFAVLLSAAIAPAQSFDLSWHTIDGGGATFSSGGVFEIGGTIGQSDAGVMTGGNFQVVGGFWIGGVINPCTLPGDLDSDHDVDLSDLATLLAHFGTPSGATLATGDIDGDHDVDLSDLSTLLAHYGATCP